MDVNKHGGMPQVLDDLIRWFDRLPGVGPKTAARLAFYWLRVPEKDVRDFTATLHKLKTDIKRCEQCFNLSTEELCPICADDKRDHSKICVVEDALDLLSIERVGKYDGVYHVLEGVISPVNNIGPEDLTLDDLISRAKEVSAGKDGGSIVSKEGNGKLEVIIATNPNMEGEATAMYVYDMLKPIEKVQVTRLAQGLPSGADLEYADKLTIGRALEKRSEFE